MGRTDTAVGGASSEGGPAPVGWRVRPGCRAEAENVGTGQAGSGGGGPRTRGATRCRGRRADGDEPGPTFYTTRGRRRRGTRKTERSSQTGNWKNDTEPYPFGSSPPAGPPRYRTVIRFGRGPGLFLGPGPGRPPQRRGGMIDDHRGRRAGPGPPHGIGVEVTEHAKGRTESGAQGCLERRELEGWDWRGEFGLTRGHRRRGGGLKPGGIRRLASVPARSGT